MEEEKNTNKAKISKKARSRGKNNEYGTVYYLRKFFSENIKPGVKWEVNRVELSGAGRKKGDIEIIINKEVTIISLKESQVQFKTQKKYLDEANKENIPFVGMRGFGEQYKRTMITMYLDDFLRLKFGGYFK